MLYAGHGSLMLTGVSPGLALIPVRVSSLGEMPAVFDWRQYPVRFMDSKKSNSTSGCHSV